MGHLTPFPPSIFLFLSSVLSSSSTIQSYDRFVVSQFLPRISYLWEKLQLKNSLEKEMPQQRIALCSLQSFFLSHQRERSMTHKELCHRPTDITKACLYLETRLWFYSPAEIVGTITSQIATDTSDGENNILIRPLGIRISSWPTRTQLVMALWLVGIIDCLFFRVQPCLVSTTSGQP